MNYIIKCVIWISIFTNVKCENVYDNIIRYNDDPYASDTLVDLELPKRCSDPPPASPNYCCSIPPIFDAEDYAKCKVAIKNSTNEVIFAMNTEEVNCRVKKCLLRINGLLKGLNDINPTGLRIHLNRWGEQNDVDQIMVDMIVERCGIDLLRTTDSCVADRLVLCFGSTLYKICPSKKVNEACAKFKIYFTECEDFFMPF